MCMNSYWRCMYVVVPKYWLYKYVWGTRGSPPKYGNQNLYSCDWPNHLSHKDFKTKREKEFICNSFTFSYVIYLSMTYLNKCPKNRGFIEYSPLSSCMDKSLSPLPSPSNQSLDRILASLEIAHVLPSSPTMSDSQGWVDKLAVPILQHVSTTYPFHLSCLFLWIVFWTFDSNINVMGEIWAPFNCKDVEGLWICLYFCEE